MQIVSYTAEGTVDVRIKGKIYTYVIDSIHIPRIEKLSRKAPWKALQELKRRNRI